MGQLGPPPDQDSPDDRESEHSDTDLALFRSICQGDERAFEELYSRYFSRLCVFAHSIVHDRNLAEDMAQEAFVHVLRAKAQFDSNRASVRTWLFRITHNICIDHRRKASTRREQPASGGSAADADGNSPIDSIPESLPTPMQRAIDEEDNVAADSHVRAGVAAVRHCFAKLQERYRTLVHLIYLEGFKFKEAAATLRIPMGTAQTWSSRARTQLNDCLRAKGLNLDPKVLGEVLPIVHDSDRRFDHDPRS